MLQDRVQSAVPRLPTERNGGGVLNPGVEAHGRNGAQGKSIFDVLQEKHPVQKQPNPSAFDSDADELPPHGIVNITAAHIEHVACRLFGSAGPCHGYYFRAVALPPPQIRQH